MELGVQRGMALVVVVAFLVQGSVYLEGSVEARDETVYAGVSDGVTGDIGPATDPRPASPASKAALEQTIQEMTQRWRTLHDACDPAAVFSLLYLITTEAVVDHIEDGYFEDNEFLAWWTIAFADRYEVAIDAWMDGEIEEISQPWLDAFQRGEAGQTDVTEDILLGINVHIRYDLGLVTQRLAIVQEERKEDYDRINDVLARVSQPASRAVAEHYDPSQAPGPASPILGPATQLVINAWREEAWTDAEVLVDVPTEALREAHVETMASKTLAANSAIDATNPSPDTEARRAYCEDRNAAHA